MSNALLSQATHAPQLCRGVRGIGDRHRGRPLRRDGGGRRRRGAAASPRAAPADPRRDVEGMTVASWEAIVVGGGPGGSTAAWRLALTGVRTLVLDAAVFPRVKICAGWVTPAALTDLELDPEKYPLTIQGFAACALAYRGARHETRWRRPASYGIIRREFDQYLLERAAAAGADVRDGIRVRAVAAGAEGVRVETDAGAYEAAVVIGAGGHRRPLAPSLRDASLRGGGGGAPGGETRPPAGGAAAPQPPTGAPPPHPR